MSYFYSEQAEYRAKRIAQMLAAKGETSLFAARDGRVMANFDGHMHLLRLDGDRLESLDHADMIRPKETMIVAENI